MPKKSKCHHERRNSPSVATWSPISSCFLMIFSISRSSTSLSWAALMTPFSRSARASFKGALRKRLPTTSARNGGLFLVIERLPLSVWPSTKRAARVSSTVKTRGHRRSARCATHGGRRRCRGDRQNVRSGARPARSGARAAAPCLHPLLISSVAKQRGARCTRARAEHLLGGGASAGWVAGRRRSALARTAGLERGMMKGLRASAHFFNRKVGFSRLGLVLSLVIVVGAAVVLYRTLRDINPGELLNVLEATDWRTLGVAGLFVCAGYLTLTLYD